MAKERPSKTASSDDGSERLHKRIAASGITSRRKAEEMIAQGRVEVNGEIVRELGTKVGPDDEVRVDGRPLASQKHYYVLMNKPTGYVTTLSDTHGRRTVAQLLPDLGVTLKPVGRLDMNTEGLLIFTNDGEFSNRLAHPRYGVEKTYSLIVEGVPDEKALEKLRKGVYIEGGKTLPAKVQVVHADDKRNETALRMTIHEGRKRQIRLMGEAVGHPVKSLRRIRIGNIHLKNLRPGECRMLSKQELEALRAEIGLD